jgi:hypothetical protein
LQNKQEESYRRKRNNFKLCLTFKAAQRIVSRGKDSRQLYILLLYWCIM